MEIGKLCSIWNFCNWFDMAILEKIPRKCNYEWCQIVMIGEHGIEYRMIHIHISIGRPRPISLQTNAGKQPDSLIS